MENTTTYIQKYLRHCLPVKLAELHSFWESGYSSVLQSPGRQIVKLFKLPLNSRRDSHVELQSADAQPCRSQLIPHAAASKCSQWWRHTKLKHNSLENFLL
jgi:hypothetical protein